MKTLAIATCLVGGFALPTAVEAGANQDVVASIAQSAPAPAADAKPVETTGTVDKEARADAGEDKGRGGRALHFQTGQRSQVADLIARHAKEAGVPVQLADAVIRIESRYNPRARNGGAVGLMQIKPRTARGLGYSGGAEGLMNPDTNLRYGMRYLAQAWRMARGDTCGAVMRYQSGHYATHISAANRAYCAKARTIMASSGN